VTAPTLTPPLVTVVVPVFRTEEYLPACLASLLGQTLPTFEVVVVDDASPGDVAGVVARAVEADPRVTLVRHRENQGVGLARITGARAARGRFLAFVDSDDEVDARFLEVLHAAAIGHGADLVQCGMVVRELDGTTVCVNRGGAEHALRGDAIVPALLGGVMSNCLGNKLVATGTFLSAIDELVPALTGVSFAEDLLTLFVLVTRARCYSHVPGPLYRYLRRPTSITLTTDANVLARNVESLSRVYVYVRSVLTHRREPPARVHAFFEREFVVPVVDHFYRARDAGTGAPAGLPASPASLGLLGALVARGLFVDDVPTPMA
jgi:glycosyltransferase involved in cell wall biosynthesis